MMIQCFDDTCMHKIIHRRNDCIGCNTCVEHAPHYWSIDDNDGKATLLRSMKKKDLSILKIEMFEKQQNQIAADHCPAGIITVT